MPKEMLPILDKPTIQYIVEEAVAAGIEDIIIVTGKHKRAIEDHFDNQKELEMILEEKGKQDLLDEVQHSSNLANMFYVRQKEQKGLGHAIWSQNNLSGMNRLSVLLGDDIVQSEVPAIKQLMNQYDDTGKSIIGVQQVNENETHRYGIVDPAESNEGLFSVNKFVENQNQEQRLQT